MTIILKQGILCCCFFLMLTGSIAQQANDKFIPLDPGGTYILKGEKRNGVIRGPFAEIRIKKLDEGQIAVTANFNGGYPSYQKETLLDTLGYFYNSFTYQRNGDSSCHLYFLVKPHGIEVTYIRKAAIHQCAFAGNAITTGFIPRHYSNPPVIVPLD